MANQCSFLALIIFFCAAFSSLQAARTRSSSSGTGTAPQTCGTNNVNFYCPVDGMCKPRNQRCTEVNICVDETGMEEGCFKSSTRDKYLVQMGHANLGSFGSKQFSLEHQFITYRGFTYEFGTYGVQILDTIDPMYKYSNGQGLNSNGVETVGSSYCTWEDATRFANGWDTRYVLLRRNCQHFSIAMKTYLFDERSCNQPPSRRQKRQDDLEQYIDQLLSNCSVVCCDNNNSAFPTAAASVLTTILIIGIVFLLQI